MRIFLTLSLSFWSPKGNCVSSSLYSFICESFNRLDELQESINERPREPRLNDSREFCFSFVWVKTSGNQKEKKKKKKKNLFTCSRHKWMNPNGRSCRIVSDFISEKKSQKHEKSFHRMSKLSPASKCFPTLMDRTRADFFCFMCYAFFNLFYDFHTSHAIIIIIIFSKWLLFTAFQFDELSKSVRTRVCVCVCVCPCFLVLNESYPFFCVE